MTALPDMICITHGIPACRWCEGKAMTQHEQLQQAAKFALEVLLWSQAGEPVPSMECEAIEQLKQALGTRETMTVKQLTESIKRGERWQVEPDPCPGCQRGGVCRTPQCGRLKLAPNHPYRQAEPAALTTEQQRDALLKVLKELEQEFGWRADGWPDPRWNAARAALAEPVLAPAPGYCKHCKQYTIEEPLPAEPVQEHENWCASVTQLLLCDPPRKAPCNCKKKVAEPVQEPVAWLRVIDEAMVTHHCGIADPNDDYETAKQKMNNLLCTAQDIGKYFEAQRKPLTDERKLITSALSLGSRS